VRFLEGQIRSCPRNCERRAGRRKPLENSGKAAPGSDPRARRPAVERTHSSRPAGDPGLERNLKTDDFSASEIAPAGESLADAAASGVTIVVCHSCRRPGDPEDYPRPGSRLADATLEAAEGTGLRVTKIGCLGNCKRGISAAMLREGSWSYVFGELAEDSAEDLIAGALLYAGATDGFMPFRARPESLKRGLIARIPTLGHLPPFDDKKDDQ
jgi:predicted metal-binding protein